MQIYEKTDFADVCYVGQFPRGPNGQIDWLFNMDAELTAWIVDRLWQAGSHIMGSRTFHDMAAFWPSSIEPFAAPMNEIPKVVFSRKSGPLTPDLKLTTAALKDTGQARSGELRSDREAQAAAASWSKAGIANGDLSEEIAYLKQQSGKDILAHGGAGFARSLVKSWLIDEYRLIVHPVA
jgi:dihydrofolate reductase